MARMLELTKELELLEEAEPAEPVGPAGAVDEAAIEDYLVRCRAGEIKTHAVGDPDPSKPSIAKAVLDTSIASVKASLPHLPSLSDIARVQSRIPSRVRSSSYPVTRW